MAKFRGKKSITAFCSKLRVKFQGVKVQQKRSCFKVNVIANYVHRTLTSVSVGICLSVRVSRKPRHASVPPLCELLVNNDETSSDKYDVIRQSNEVRMFVKEDLSRVLNPRKRGEG